MDALTVLAELSPEDRARPALVTDDFAWSFGDLAIRAAALASRFEARGVRPGDRVALVAAPTPEVFVAIHALVAMGATLVPIHPRLTPAEVQTTLDVARPQHVLDASELALPSADTFARETPAAGDASGVAFARETPGAGDVSGSSFARETPGAGDASGVAFAREASGAGDVSGSSFARETPVAGDVSGSSFARETPAAGDVSGSSFARAAIGPAAAFAIVSTSGTTGRPKGAVLSRGAIAASAEASARNLGWREEDRWLLAMPLAHVGGLSILTRCLIARRAVVLLPRFEAALVLEAIERHAVTLLSVVPTMLRALLEVDVRDVLARPRVVLLGGAAAPASLLEACAARGVRALTTYGLTEACSQVTSQAPRDPAVRLAGSGAPLAGFELRIAGEDGDPLASAAPGGAATATTTGRIQIRGPAMFDGYLLPDGTLDPARTQDGFFDTGDLGELDERGHLLVHVRRTDLVVTGGENVYPAEVEQVIEAIPGVRRALVLGVPDERWGQVVAVVIEADGDSVDPVALLDAATRSLAAHKRPRRFAIVDRLPLTTSGKVDRKDALARFGPSLRQLERAS